MTNREWLESLSDEELAKFMMWASNCKYCAFGNSKKCGDVPCVRAKKMWLRAEHKEDTDDVPVS